MKILLLAAHPDDLEFGMGATISKLKRQQHNIKAMIFSDCSIFEECSLSMDYLKIHYEIFDYKVRRLDQKRQQILEMLVLAKKEFNPDVVYIPSSFDMHQDHQVIQKEGLRAFKHCTLYGYSFSWNNIAEDLRHFEVVEKKDVLRKLTAINFYKSQKGRYYSKPDYVMSEIKHSGTIINRNFAEQFELIRNIK